jgi:hypothetical protein
VRAKDTLRVLRHGLLHPQRRVARPHRVILVGERRPEERHDPIAHHLVHGALVPVDSLHHALEDWVEKLPRLLGIPVGKQLHRALQIGEENRHLLALALQRALGDADLLGEALGGVGLWGVESRSRRRRDRWPRRMATLGTKPRRRRQWPAARGARPGQRCGAGLAELRADLILVLTPRTLHRPAPYRCPGSFPLHQKWTERSMGNAPVSPASRCTVPT